MRKVLSVLGVFVIVTFGTGSRCNEVTGPDRTPTPSPTTSLVPVVTGVEPSEKVSNYYDAWAIVGHHLAPGPIATLESGGSVIQLFVLYERPTGEYLVVVPNGTPGAYTPCVRTSHGKGCGNFLVTVP
jgi:hypothetical protein